MMPKSVSPSYVAALDYLGNVAIGGYYRRASHLGKDGVWDAQYPYTDYLCMYSHQSLPEGAVLVVVCKALRA